MRKTTVHTRRLCFSLIQGRHFKKKIVLAEKALVLTRVIVRLTVLTASLPQEAMKKSDIAQQSTSSKCNVMSPLRARMPNFFAQRLLL